MKRKDMIVVLLVFCTVFVLAFSSTVFAKGPIVLKAVSHLVPTMHIAE